MASASRSGPARRRRTGRGADAGRITAAAGRAAHLRTLELLRAIGVEEDVKRQSELGSFPKARS